MDYIAAYNIPAGDLSSNSHKLHMEAHILYHSSAISLHKHIFYNNKEHTKINF